MALTLSERAAAEIRRMLQQQDLPDGTALRVSVVGGGCSGFEYHLSFENPPQAAEDLVVHSHGIPVVVDSKSARLVQGTEIDIHEGLDKRGFVFHNPLAVRTCGCGSSFQV